ncbi:ADP-ribosyltransferase domain-containing protein [Skermania piniformis]|uniref:NAD(+)--protein-arginine ADP-ribosyltransferase n=1 Tax=Skermania pinensis TaxID=39122 RepID=A0ABX8SDC3_9ACTN|nr:ADP-ribosyltransferase domain-containing protein [Skermania piniformis]QXQ15306.1 ADP-ribosyltransferase [Skermania piniformis]
MTADRVQALINALAKLPPYVGPVFRGTNLPADIVEFYVPGILVTEFAFVSTTADPASEFPVSTELEIFSRNGKSISALSVDPAEQEVLFPAYTTFEILGREVDPVTGKTCLRLTDTGWLGGIDPSRAVAGKVFSTPDQLGIGVDRVPSDQVTAMDRALAAARAARKAVPRRKRIVRSDKFWDDLPGTGLDA